MYRHAWAVAAGLITAVVHAATVHGAGESIWRPVTALTFLGVALLKEVGFPYALALGVSAACLGMVTWAGVAALLQPGRDRLRRILFRVAAAIAVVDLVTLVDSVHGAHVTTGLSTAEIAVPVVVDVAVLAVAWLVLLPQPSTAPPFRWAIFWACWCTWLASTAFPVLYDLP